jgi:hypothetical protein
LQPWWITDAAVSGIIASFATAWVSEQTARSSMALCLASLALPPPVLLHRGIVMS